MTRRGDGNDRPLLRDARVVVVDADAAARGLLRDVFERAGMTVVDEATGAAGLEVARGQPDLVVVNARLPDMSGLDVTSTLKGDPLTQQVPVIVHSETSSGADAEIDGLIAGADAHLDDPIRPDVLLATAESLFRHRELSQQLELALSLDVTGVYDWNVATGQIRWSESLERIHRMEPGGFGGTFDDFVAVVHPDDRERIGAEIAEGLASSESLQIAYRFHRVDGVVGWMEGRGRIFRNREGDPVRVLGLAHDVTPAVHERRRVDQLRRLASALNAARTSNAVLNVLQTELEHTNVGVAFVGEDEPMHEDVTFSYVVARHRLDLTVADGQGAGPRTGEELSTRQAVAIGELAGGALDRALRYEAERSNAAALQRALLSTRTPNIDGWEIDATYEPASEEERLGGDFYDVLTLDDRFVVMVGDVAGHGLAATRQMGTVRTLLRTMAATHHGDPVAVLGHARALFDDVCGAHTPFVTAIVATFEITSGKVAIAAAGHPPPIVGGDGRCELVDLTPDPPLGVASSTGLQARVLTLEEGEWFGLYTDGVFETRSMALDRAVAAGAARLGPHPSALDLLAAGEQVEAHNLDDRAAVIVGRASR